MEDRESEHEEFHWVKSSYSGGSGTECLEVAALTGTTTGVRDSKDPRGPVLAFSHVTWAQFVAAVRQGKFD
ncbi:DUF397 domain-containing protein [Streptomyces sp. NPDC004647]|uniref:DUF397 domain-containing protein n=1 Tax=Streptomyces sp. NPDC004647 TaxID=3154671 RepID=UPI0033B10148